MGTENWFTKVESVNSERLPWSGALQMRDGSSMEKLLSAKNDLHVMKRMLYDAGWRTGARQPNKRSLKLEVVSYGEITSAPPSPNLRKLICLKMHFMHFPVF